MPLAERDGERIVLTTEYNEREMVKQVPGVRWSTDENLWWMPLSWAACCQLRGVFGELLQVGAQLGEWSRGELASRIRPCLALRDAEDSEALAMFTELRPFQRAGADFLRTAKHALLADEMGLGKTVQAIAALEAIGADAYPALIVCPNSMKRNWQREFAKWAPARITEIAGNTAKTRRDAINMVKEGNSDVLIINYEALRLVTRLAKYGMTALDEKDKQEKELNEVAWKSAIGDEVHRAKDPHTKQTRALWWVTQHCQHRFGLTGTPVANSPEDMWTLMRFVAPHEFPAKTKFIERYAQASFNIYGGLEVTGIKGEMGEELFKIVDPRFIRRTKAAVLPELPPKIYTQREVEMPAKQKKAYEEMRKHSMAELESGVLMAANPLTKMLRLSQFASACGEFGDPAFSVWLDGKRTWGPYPTPEQATDACNTIIGNALAVNDNATAEGSYVKDETPLILTSPSCKVDALLEVVGELGDQRAAVFAVSRQLIELAAKALDKVKIPFGQITGAVPEQMRQQNLDNFTNNRTKLLLIQTAAGGEGLSLPGCSTAIFMQHPFSKLQRDQCEDRIDGIGRGVEGVPSEIIDLITVGTIEPDIFEAMKDKERMLQEIARDAETVKKWLSR